MDDSKLAMRARDRSGASRGKGLVPLVFGVSGHRDIAGQQLGDLQRSLSNYFRDQQALYPYTRMVLLTGLAEGADQIAAECALAEGWEVGAVLALPLEDFEQDFSPATRGNLHRLVNSCHWTHVVSTSGTPRPDCYVNVSLWIARYAHALIAIWDGDKINPKPGGTAFTVQLFLEGIPVGRDDFKSNSGNPERSLRRRSAHLPDTGPVLHFKVNRSSAPPPVHGYGKVSLVNIPPIFVERKWEEVRNNINNFNTVHAGLSDRDFTNDGIFVPNGLAAKPELGINLPEGRACRLYGVADHLARTRQASRAKRIVLSLTLGAIGLVIEQLYSGPLGHYSELLWVSVLFIAVAIAVATQEKFRGTSADVASQFLDYRALAEASRVQYFWKRCGVEDCSADHHLTDQSDELEWIRQAVRATELGGPERSANIDWTARIDEARVSWLEGQYNYFKKQTTSTGKIRKKRERLVWVLISLAGLAAILIPLLHGATEQSIQWIQVLYGVLLIGAAAVGTYLRLEGLAEKERNYWRMELTMSAALDNLSRASRSGHHEPVRLELQREILREAGKAALDENSDWVLLLRERPIRPLG